MPDLGPWGKVQKRIFLKMYIKLLIYTFLNHKKLHISKASVVGCTQGLSMNQKI